AKANQLAHYLRGMGVGPDQIVGIMVERSPEMMIGVLGILKAGGAYLPIDPSYPEERIRYILVNSRTSILITHDSLHMKCVAPDDIQIVALDRNRIVIQEEVNENPRTTVTSSNLAYVIYTSGSTGKPKGVLIEHNGAVNMAAAQRKVFHLNDCDRILQFASFGFDASVWEFVMALSSGGAICLGNNDNLIPGERLAYFIQQSRITVATLTPSALSLLNPDDPALQTLRVVIVAGEDCPEQLVNQWLQQGCQLYNAYGPTEITVCATIGQMAANIVNIGRPIINKSVYVLDSNRKLVPIG
ncbi:AMP-binding protein, partial [Alicyclobacillus fodiniaquatilis]